MLHTYEINSRASGHDLTSWSDAYAAVSSADGVYATYTADNGYVYVVADDEIQAAVAALCYLAFVERHRFVQNECTRCGLQIADDAPASTFGESCPYEGNDENVERDLSGLIHDSLLAVLR